MTRMTQNGISTTQKGQEQYEAFYYTHRGERVEQIMYDYRTDDGELFSVVSPTLKRVPTETGRMARKKEIANSRNIRQAEQPCEELLR